MRGSSIKRALLALCATGISVMAIGSAAATADTTHVFVKNIEIPGVENVQPVGVDDDGNLLVWINSTNDLGKFDVNGNPVNFSGLGTHLLDGAGSFDCPKTLADCDQVPTTNGFQNGTRPGNETVNIVAVDHSGGPADGYIYILNNYVDVEGRNQAEVDVFDETGKYRGKIDQSQVFPARGGLEEYFEGGISVASNGVLYIVVPGPHLTLTHVDRYVPVDENPAHTQFSGQIRAACANAVCVASLATFSMGAGSSKYFYASGFDATHGESSYYMRFPMEEFRRAGLLNFAVSEDFDPDVGPFETGGYYPPFNSNLRSIGIDPETEHVFIGEGWAGFQEWDENNEQVGPVFAAENCPGNAPYPPLDPNCHIGDYFVVDSIAFDRSGGPNDGNIYIRAPQTNRIAVYSPPVIIPDIGEPSVEESHTTADLSVDLGLAGGSEITSCRVDWGFHAPTVSAPYPFTKPCEQTLPFASDTEATVKFTGLFPETDYHYRVVAGNSTAENRTNDNVFHTVAVLDVQTDPATNLDRTSGDLNGSLNPDGIDTTYFYEYGSTTQYNNRTPQRSAGSGAGPQSLPPEHIEGLQAGRTYHYRLVAKNSLGKTKGPDRTFLVPANPTIAGVRATNVAEGSADLNARINPLGFETTYRFEYGTSPSYGSRTPDVVLGSQLEPQLVTESISDFQPGVVIHFRVIAENEWGTTTTADSTFSYFPPDCPNSHVRQQTDANYLPDCRAYELVSPGNAGSVTLFPGEITRGADGGFSFGPEFAMLGPNSGGAASAPSRFGYFGGEGAIPGLPVPNGLMDRYLATRTTTGWITTYPGRPGHEALIAARPRCNLAMDICIDYRTPPLLGGGGGTGSNAPYVWDAEGRSLGRWPTNLSLVPNGDQGVADDEPSANFGHYVFSSVNTPFAPGGLDEAPGTIYDNDIANKTVEIASLTPGGEQIPREDVPSADPGRKTEIAGVSTTGDHILMAATTAPYCENGPFGVCPEKLSYPAHLFMRVDGTLTYEVSPGPVAMYKGMTADGSQVFFTSESHLTPEDTDGSIDLYRWSEETDSIDLLSQGNGNGDSDLCTAQWASGCDVKTVTTKRPDLDDTIASQSGDIYFYSPEQLDPDRPGVQNERNLYVFRDGAPQLVSTMDPGTEVDRMQISPTGDHMAFLSRTQATAYVNIAPNDGGDPTKWQEMYVFDPGTGEVLCASCIPSGQPPTILTTDTGFASFTHNYDVKASQSGRFMSDDGRVGFATADALVPLDTNQKIDVYEYVNNSAHLITSGTDERDTQGGAIFYPTLHTGFESISRDGVDLFFSTFETFVPEDLNGSFVKFYDARTGGGFPIDIGLLPCTAADECHGDTSLATPEIGMGTLGDLGSGGNHALTKQKQKKKKKAKKRKRRRGKSSQKPKRGKSQKKKRSGR